MITWTGSPHSNLPRAPRENGQLLLVVEKLTNGIFVACAGVVAAVLAGLIVVVQLPDRMARRRGYTGAPGMFALDRNFQPGRTHQLLSAYGDVGRRELITAHLVFDLPFLVAYTAFLAGVLARSDRPERVVLPLAAGVADVLEDAGIIQMARRFPGEGAALVRTTFALTVVKHSLYAVSFGLMLAEVTGRNRTKRL